MKKYATFIILIIICLLVFAYTLSRVPNPIDWQYSFSQRHKKPFGCEILRSQLHHTFPGQTITNLRHDYNLPEKSNTFVDGFNLILIDSELRLTNYKCRWLMDEAAKGSHILLASNVLPQLFQDTFQLTIVKDTIIHLLKEQEANYVLPHAGERRQLVFHFTKNITNHHFEAEDFDILSCNTKGQPVYIRKKMGEGAIYFHCNPLVFTNYHMVTGPNYPYAFGCLSELPLLPTYWDEYHKTVNRSSMSPIMYIHRYPLLKQAWYLLWLVMVLYLVLEVRRRQRAIPAWNKPPNNTLEFVKTLGRLYLAKKDHLDIATKKYSYFKDHVKRKYHLKLDAGMQQEKIVALAEKSGLPVKSIRQVMEMGEKLQTLNTLSETELINFNRTVEFFYNNCK